MAEAVLHHNTASGQTPYSYLGGNKHESFNGRIHRNDLISATRKRRGRECLTKKHKGTQ